MNINVVFEDKEIIVDKPLLGRSSRAGIKKGPCKWTFIFI